MPGVSQLPPVPQPGFPDSPLSCVCTAGLAWPPSCRPRLPVGGPAPFSSPRGEALPGSLSALSSPSCSHCMFSPAPCLPPVGVTAQCPALGLLWGIAMKKLARWLSMKLSRQLCECQLLCPSLSLLLPASLALPPRAWSLQNAHTCTLREETPQPPPRVQRPGLKFWRCDWVTSPTLQASLRLSITHRL